MNTFATMNSEMNQEISDMKTQEQIAKQTMQYGLLRVSTRKSRVIMYAGCSHVDENKYHLLNFKFVSPALGYGYAKQLLCDLIDGKVLPEVNEQ